MRYWNEQIGYITSGTSFILNGVKYTRDWLTCACDYDLNKLNIIKEPSYDPETQVLETDNELGWVVREKTQEDLDSEQEELENANDIKKETLIYSLWESALKYEQKYISGSAPTKIGLLSLGENVKASAVAQWIEDIWADYYSRKLQVLSGDFQVSMDFSNHGPIPYTVWEIIYGE